MHGKWMQLRVCRLPALAGLVLLPGLSVSLGAQQTRDLARFRACATCKLMLSPIVRLGTDDGDGTIDSDVAQLRYSDSQRLYAVFSMGGSSLQLFDSSGTFLRKIGTKGTGPGEIHELVDAHFAGNNLLLLEANAKLMTLSTGGVVLSEHHVLEVPFGPFRVISDTTVVIGAMSRRSSSVGYPLHAVSRITGRVARHFGSLDGKYSAAVPYARLVLLGWATQGATVWGGRVSPVQFEEWGLDNSLRRTIRGDMSWMSVGRQSDGWPGTIVSSFGIDSEERLLMITLVPDAGWRQAPRHGAEGYVLQKDTDQLYDARLDVFDLRNQVHLGTLTWNEAFVFVTRIGQRLGITKLEYDNRDRARLAAYDVRVGTP